MSNRRDGTHDSTAGAYALSEILSQPQVWSACFDLLHSEKRLVHLKERFASKQEWLFVGCGSSYYIALAAAGSMNALTGLRARAVPASEVLLYPELTFKKSDALLPVLISRSGKTSEVLRAAQVFRDRNIQTLAISCATGQALEKLATESLLLPPADEHSLVMTRSVTSMLLALQALAAEIVSNNDFLDSLRSVADAAEKSFRDVPAQVREFIDSRSFDDYVSLAQGTRYGLACECALKMTEMSLSYAQVFHTLEFRHGPKSIVGPRTLLFFLLSDSSYKAECEVLEEMKQLGGTTLVVCNRAQSHVRSSADLLIELRMDVPELARLAPTLYALQLAGLYTGLKKGLDPDHPKNLSRVVELRKDPTQTEEHASL